MIPELREHRQRLLETDPTCAYCGRLLTFDTATLDHVRPRSRGGTDAADNLVLACRLCNGNKGNAVDGLLACYLQRGRPLIRRSHLLGLAAKHNWTIPVEG